jgi:hypothetical protein
MTGYRPKGGRRPGDFPDAVFRDYTVIELLRYRPVGATRNLIAELLETEPRKITYSLQRLAARGLVEHVARGCEGHGFWRIKE